MPHHRARAAGLDEIRKPVEVLEHLRGMRTLHAKRTALSSESLVAADVEVGRIAEVLVHLGDDLAHDALRLRVHDTPHPSARLEKRLVFRIDVERGMLLGEAARERRMAVAIELRDQRNAEITAYRHQAPHLRPVERSIRPREPRILHASVRSPRLDNRIIELEKRREANGALDLLAARLGEPAKMHCTKRKMGLVHDRKLRQDAPFGLERPALGDCELPKRIARPPDSRERARLDLHARCVDLGGIRFVIRVDLPVGLGIGGRLRKRKRARSYDDLRSRFAEPLGEMRLEPLGALRIGALERHHGRRIKRHIRRCVHLEFLLESLCRKSRRQRHGHRQKKYRNFLHCLLLLFSCQTLFLRGIAGRT